MPTSRPKIGDYSLIHPSFNLFDFEHYIALVTWNNNEDILPGRSD